MWVAAAAADDVALVRALNRVTHTIWRQVIEKRTDTAVKR